MVAGALEIQPATQLAACAAVGAVLGGLLPSRLTPSRWVRTAEGAANAALFGFLFLLGSGRLDDRQTDPIPILAGAVGVVIYFLAADQVARRWPVQSSRDHAAIE